MIWITAAMAGWIGEPGKSATVVAVDRHKVRKISARARLTFVCSESGSTELRIYLNAPVPSTETEVTFRVGENSESFSFFGTPQDFRQPLVLGDGPARALAASMTSAEFVLVDFDPVQSPPLVASFDTRGGRVLLSAIIGCKPAQKPKSLGDKIQDALRAGGLDPDDPAVRRALGCEE